MYTMIYRIVQINEKFVIQCQRNFGGGVGMAGMKAINYKNPPMVYDTMPSEHQCETVLRMTGWVGRIFHVDHPVGRMVKTDPTLWKMPEGRESPR